MNGVGHFDFAREIPTYAATAGPRQSTDHSLSRCHISRTVPATRRSRRPDSQSRPGSAEESGDRGKEATNHHRQHKTDETKITRSKGQASVPGAADSTPRGTQACYKQSKHEHVRSRVDPNRPAAEPATFKLLQVLIAHLGSESHGNSSR